VLERCSEDGTSLLEVTLDFRVENNTAPKFSLPIEKKFIVDGKQINYTLPETVDTEDNDAVIVQIRE
jgi:hypothetical protein